MNLFNDDIDVTKYYKKTFWMLRIYSSILSIGFFILSIVFLFLDKKEFPMKYTTFGYLIVASIGVEVFYLIITSILMRFVFRDEINYKRNRNIQIKSASQRTNNIQESDDSPQINDNYDDTANYISNDFQNCVSKKSKNSMSAHEKASTSIIVIVTIVVIVALILSIIFTK